MLIFKLNNFFSNWNRLRINNNIIAINILVVYQLDLSLWFTPGNCRVINILLRLSTAEYSAKCSTGYTCRAKCSARCGIRFDSECGTMSGNNCVVISVVLGMVFNLSFANKIDQFFNATSLIRSIISASSADCSCELNINFYKLSLSVVVSRLFLTLSSTRQ